jgi:hypothetical protein
VEDILQFMFIEAIEDETKIVIRVLFTEASLIMLSKICPIDEEIVSNIESAIFTETEENYISKEEQDKLLYLVELTAIITTFIDEYICSDADAVAIHPTNHDSVNEFEAIISVDKGGRK